MATRLSPSDNVICSSCKKEKPLDGYGICEKCRLAKIKTVKKYINAGLCVTGCGNKIIGNKRYCIECNKINNIRSKNDTIKYRQLCLEQYGSKCICCGETTYEFLTFDHINNDGAKHFYGNQKKRLTGKTLCRWIIKNNYPDTIQILCWNCNCAKEYYGICPHQKENNEQIY